MTTLAELISAVRDEVHDPYGYRWSDGTITRHLNGGQVDLARDSRKLHAWQLEVAAGDVSVNRPSDLLVPKYAYYYAGNTGRYQLRFVHDYPESSCSGVPEKVCVVGDTYYLYPVPSVGGTLVLLGVRRPTDMVDPDDTPDVEDADVQLTTYAAWQCFLSDGDPMASVMGDYYAKLRAEWLVLDAMKNPITNVIEREWWE